jgi:hypothetical protein
MLRDLDTLLVDDESSKRRGGHFYTAVGAMRWSLLLQAVSLMCLMAISISFATNSITCAACKAGLLRRTSRDFRKLGAESAQEEPSFRLQASNGRRAPKRRTGVELSVTNLLILANGLAFLAGKSV